MVRYPLICLYIYSSNDFGNLVIYPIMVTNWSNRNTLSITLAQMITTIFTMIRELSCGINDFSMTEITDILAYISTN